MKDCISTKKKQKDKDFWNKLLKLYVLICVLLTKEEKTPNLLQSGESNMHQVPRLCTKVKRID